MVQAFQRDYLLRLPLPLAQLYSRSHNAKDARSRHDNTFYLFEALIKLMAAPAVMLYLHEVGRGAARVESLDRLLAQLALPSLGQWLAMLRELARYFSSRPDAAGHPLGRLWAQLDEPRRDLSAVLALYRRIKNGPDGEPAYDRKCSLWQLLEALVQYRNAVFGHGGPRFASFYEQDMGPLLIPAATEVLAEGTLDLLGPRGSRLVHIGPLRLLDGGRVEVGVRELTGLQGERLPPLLLPKAEAALLAPESVGLLWPGQALPLCLGPLLIYRESELAEEVLFFNRDRSRRQVEYLSYTTGRIERDWTTAPALAGLLSRITGRPVGAADIEALAEQSRRAEGMPQPAAADELAESDYELLAEIGRGGMGVVYLARQLSLGRLVALKTLPGELIDDEATLTRWQREIRALARCDHPHIVKVLSSGVLPDGRPYYTMEYIPGCDLELVWREVSSGGKQADTSRLAESTWAEAVLSAARKQRQQTLRQPAQASGIRAGTAAPAAPELPPLPSLAALPDDRGGYVRRVAALLRDAAQALQAVHDQGLIHRDVKPANLMLSPDGTRVVLMDFGLVKGQSLTASNSRTGGLLGTLRYAAPEQLAAATLKVGPAADVRGLGVTLWELLTRQRLFGDAADEKQLAQKVHDEDVPRLRDVDPGLDRDLEAIVARATERRVSDRIASAGQLADYLQMYLDGRPLPIRPPGRAELFWRWCQRNRALAAASALALAALVAVAVISSLAAAREADNAGRLKDALDISETRQAQLIETDRQRQAALRQSAGLVLDRAIGMREQEGAARGMLVLASGLALVPPDAEDLAWSFRARLGAWRREVCPLVDILPHPGPVHRAAFSPDGRVMLTSSNKEVYLWDAATGKRLHTLTCPHAILATAFTPDSQNVLTASAQAGLLMEERIGEVRLWDVARGQPLGRPLPQRQGVLYLSFSPDGKVLLTAADAPAPFPNRSQTQVRLWRVGAHRDASLYQPIGEPLPIEQSDPMNTLWASEETLAFTPDSKVLLSAGPSGKLERWATSTAQSAGPPLRHPRAIRALALSSDGKVVLTSCLDGQARLWSLVTGKLLRYPIRGKMPHVVAFHPFSDILLTASVASEAGNKPTAEVQLWRTGLPAGVSHESAVSLASSYPDSLTSFSVPGPVSQCVFSPDGQTLLTRAGQVALPTEVRLWDAATGTLRSAPLLHTPDIKAVAFSPDSKRLLTAGQDGTARVWDVSPLDPASVSLAHPGTDRRLSSREAVSPDARRAVTWRGDDSSARLWDLSAEKPSLRALAHRYPVQSAAFSPDGRWLATASGEQEIAQMFPALKGVLRAWPIAELGKGSAPALRLLARLDAPVGDLTVAGKDAVIAAGNSILRWDLSRGKEAARVTLHAPYTLALSPDGQIVAGVGQEQDFLHVRLYSGGTGKALTAAISSGFPHMAMFSADGKFCLAVGDADFYVWNLSRGKLPGRPWQYRGRLLAAAFQDEGKVLWTCGGNKVQRWESATGKPLGPAFDLQASTSAAFNGDASMVAGVSPQGIELLATATGRSAGHLNTAGQVVALAFSPDGKLLAGATDTQVCCWEVGTCRLLGQVSVTGSAHRLAFTTEGKELLVATNEIDRETRKRKGEARLWDALTGEPRGGPLVHEQPVTGVVFSPDGRYLLTALPGSVRLWDVTSGKPVGKAMAHDLASGLPLFSADGAALATFPVAGKAQVVEVATGSPLGPVMAFSMGNPLGTRHRVALSPDGRRLAAAPDFQGDIRVYDSATGKPYGPALPQVRQGKDMSFSPDGRVLAIAGANNEARLWDVESGHPRGEPLVHPTTVGQVDFSRDGKTLLTITNAPFFPAIHEARLWETGSGKPLAGPLRVEGTNLIQEAGLTPDGRAMWVVRGDVFQRRHLPAPVRESPEHLILWAQVLSGMEVDAQGALQWLDPATWQERRRLLADRGGPPLP